MIQGILETKVVVQTVLLAGLVAVLWYYAMRAGIRRYRSGHTASGYWASLLLLTGWYLFPWMLGHAGWYGRDGYREVLFYLPLQQLLFFGPLLYLLTRQVTGRPIPGLRRILHFLPPGLYLLWSGWMALSDLVLTVDIAYYADGRDRDLLPAYQLIGYTSYLIYALASLVAVRSPAESASTSHRQLHRLLGVVIGLIVLRGIYFLIFPGFGHFSAYFYFYLAYGCAFAWLAVRTKLPTEGPGGRGTRSGTEVRDLREKFQTIQQLLETERIYREPELQVSDVAVRLALPKKEVSTIIRVSTGGNFSDLVNGYRVREVQRLIADERHRERTLLALALEAGFNSKSTFNRVFKQQTGRTPRQFAEESDLEEVSDRRLGRLKD